MYCTVLYHTSVAIHRASHHRNVDSVTLTLIQSRESIHLLQYACNLRADNLVSWCAILFASVSLSYHINTIVRICAYTDRESITTAHVLTFILVRCSLHGSFRVVMWWYSSDIVWHSVRFASTAAPVLCWSTYTYILCDILCDLLPQLHQFYADHAYL